MIYELDKESDDLRPATEWVIYFGQDEELPVIDDAEQELPEPEPEHPCHMCVDEGVNPPGEGTLYTGTKLDYRDTYSGGENAGQYKRIVFNMYLCDQHADDDRFLSIRPVRKRGKSK